LGHGSRIWTLFVPILLCAALLLGCKQKQQAAIDHSVSAGALFDQAAREFHVPSAEAKGVERERLLSEAAKRYSELLKKFPDETNLCAQSLRALGSIHASQGKTNEAVKLYAAVGEKYASQDWEVLQAWKAAADLLWDSNQRGDAKKFYAKIVERFGKSDAPQIIQQVVRGSKVRLAE
jgi:tetratricopeptide (TPR) repeat protein